MPMDNDDLESLLIRLPQGDLEALEALYQEFYHAIYAYSLLLLKNREHAQDNAQDVFLRIWEKSSTYRSGGNPKAWMMSIAHNLAADRFRRSSRESSLDDLPADWPDSGPLPEQPAADHLDLETALHKLAAEDRKIVLLKAVAGLPSIAVSRLLKIAPSTVHWRYRRALRLLAQWMEE
jgi:RNA polymerase sigma factor (sigma-70 family)